MCLLGPALSEGASRGTSERPPMTHTHTHTLYLIIHAQTLKYGQLGSAGFVFIVGRRWVDGGEEQARGCLVGGERS